MFGTMMTTFVACDKDEPYVDPAKVIESEVVDLGTAEDVEETVNGTAGVSLSYESWIVVHQVFADGSTSQPSTRSASSVGNKISIILESKLTDVSAVANVSGFEMKEAVNTVDYRKLGSAKHATQPFVTVTDSATVYTVDYGTFAIEFLLPYQTAVYDDGITKVTMPYHKYADIRDNGGELSDLESVTENGVTYLRKLYKHSIEADFNGKSYTVHAEIVLKKEQKGDYLLSKKVVDEGVELVSYDLEKKTGVSKSWIKIEETWSESGVKYLKKEVLLHNRPSDAAYPTFMMYLSEKCNFSDLVIGEPQVLTEGMDTKNEDGMLITAYSSIYCIPVIYPTEDKKTDFAFGLVFEKAVYSDEGFEYEMPAFEFSNPRLSMSQGSDWYLHEEGGNAMDIDFVAKINFGETTYTYVNSGCVICRGR